MATTSSGFIRSKRGRAEEPSTRRRTSGMRDVPPTEDRPIELARSEARERQRVLRHLEAFARRGARPSCRARRARGRNREIEVRAADAERDLAEGATCDWSCDVRAILTPSAACRSRSRVCPSLRGSKRCWTRNASAMRSAITSSMSSPPRNGSPAVARTSKSVPVEIEEGRSRTFPLRSRRSRSAPLAPLPRPYASAAAVGSFKIRSTSRPETRPATLVDARWSSLKCAGTVMTARSTRSPSATLCDLLARSLQHERPDLRERVRLAAGDDERALAGAPPSCRTANLRGALSSSSGLFHVRPSSRFTLAIVFFASIARRAFCGVSHEDLAVRMEAHHAREETTPLLVGDHAARARCARMPRRCSWSRGRCRRPTCSLRKYHGGARKPKDSEEVPLPRSARSSSWRASGARDLRNRPRRTSAFDRLRERPHPAVVGRGEAADDLAAQPPRRPASP